MPGDEPASSGSRGGKKRQAVLRLFRTTLVVLASLVALYVLAINLFLSTSLFAKVVNASPDTIDIHFERAWSIVPRHIHAKKLSIRGRDGNVEWILRLDDVEFDVSFASFLKQRFQASNVHGTGLSFRLRQRLEAAPASPEEVATLPSIEGLPPYSIRPPRVPWPALWDDARYNLWTAHLEGIVAKDVREIWIDHTRFEGSAQIDGRFYFKPVRAIEVGPAHVSVARGVVSTRGRSVADGLDGSSLDATLARLDPRTAGGADAIHRLSFDCDARVAFPDVDEMPLPIPEGVTVHGAAAVPRAVLHMRSGVLQPGSHLEASVPDAIVASRKHRATGSLALEGAIVPAPARAGGRLTFRAEAAKVRVAHAVDAQGTMKAFLGAPRVVATGDSDALDLASPFADLHFVLDMPEGDLPSARELSRYIPPKTPVSIERGRAKAEARFEAWLGERRATGRGALHAEDLDIGLAKMRARGQTSVQAAFASYRFDSKRVEGATLVMEVSEGSLTSAAAPDTPLVHLSVARLAAHAAAVDLADPLRALHVAISVPSADIVSRGLLRAYLPKGSKMQIASGHSRFALDVDLVIAEHLARGSLDVRWKELMLAYADLRLDTRVRARARVHDWHWETGELALDDAKVEVEDLTISKTGSGHERGTPAMSLERLTVEAKSPHFAFDDPLARVVLSASLLKAKVHDSSAINAFLPEKATFALEADEATFGARIDVDVENHTGKGALRAHANRMGAGGRTLHLRGDVDLSAEFVDWNFEKNTMNLVASQVAMTDVTGRLGDQGPQQLSAERVALSDRAPTFDLARPTLKGADLHLAVDGGELPDARALVPLMPENGVVRIESGAAYVEADVTASASRRTATGGIDIALMNAGLRFKESRLSGDLLLSARLSGFDPDRSLLDLSGSHLEMRNVAVTGASATTSGWRADATLSRASLRLGPRALFDGVVTLDARDARPLLAIVFGSKLPGIAVRLTDVPRLSASVRLIATADEIALFDLDAHGGDVALRGSYAERGSRRRGAIIARKAFLSAGLRLDEGGTRLRLFGLEGWLRDQTGEVRKVLDVEDGR